jgi:heme-degrading monooxygenase HmoA
MIADVAEEVVLINAFEVPAGDAETFIAAWEKTRDYLRAQPGYVDTALHQAVRAGAEFEFVNVARWRSAGDFVAATQSTGFREAAAGLAGYRPHPALYRVVRT